MMRRVLRLSPLVLVLALGACAPAAPDTATDVSAIDALRNEWQAAYNAGDTTRLTALYTDDAIRMEPNEGSQMGRDAIVQAFDALFAQASIDATVTSEETQIMGDWAFDRGSFTVTATPKADGVAPTHDEGKYIVLLQRQADGGWLLAREMSNSNLPVPAMSAMPTGEMNGMDHQMP